MYSIYNVLNQYTHVLFNHTLTIVTADIFYRIMSDSSEVTFGNQKHRDNELGPEDSVSQALVRYFGPKRSLPESPTKLAQVIKHVVDNATQRKKICLRTVGLTNRNSPVKAKRALASISSANSRQGTWTTSAT